MFCQFLSMRALPIARVCIAAALAFSLLQTAQAAATPADTVAVVNGVNIRASQLNALVEQGVRNGTPRNEHSDAQARYELVRRELLWQQAKKSGYEESPAVVSALEEQKRKGTELPIATYQTLVVREYLKDFVEKHAITEAELKSTYDAMVAQGGRIEYHAKDIVVGSRTEALELIQRIKRGENFEALAAQSANAQIRSSGGDLGWGSAARFTPAITKALSTLDKGSTKDTPVQVGDVFHVLKLEDRRRIQPTPFPTMKPLLEQQLLDEQIYKLVKQLTAKAKINYFNLNVALGPHPVR